MCTCCVTGATFDVLDPEIKTLSGAFETAGQTNKFKR
jgi:hypothetical protein